MTAHARYKQVSPRTHLFKPLGIAFWRRERAAPIVNVKKRLATQLGHCRVPAKIKLQLLLELFRRTNKQ